MMRFFRPVAMLAASVLALGASVASAAPANMVSNGSFELPRFHDNSINGSAGEGWTGPAFGPRIIRGNIEDGNGVLYGKTTFGHQYLGLAGISPTGVVASVSQMVNGFVAGQKYELVVMVADADSATKRLLEITFDDGVGNVVWTKRFPVEVAGPYVDTIAFKPQRVILTSPVTGSLNLTIANPTQAQFGQQPGLILVDKVMLAPVAE